MIPVSLSDLSAHWPMVEKGLLEIIRRTGEKWTPTHVLQALNEGWARLFVCEDGFCILQPRKDDWTSEPYVNLWAMWFKPGTAKAREQELRDWLDGITNKQVRGSSPRMGWGRALGPDWEIERVIWRRKT